MDIKFKRQTNGFSLIELMVTVGILTVIAGIAFPIYTGYMNTARFSEAQNEFAAIKLAQEEYYLENNTYFGPVANAADPTAASGGMYTTQDADLKNFSIAISSPCGDFTQCYRITATGKNEMAGESVTFNKP
jgi:type IV pilus assembly protein PilE